MELHWSWWFLCLSLFQIERKECLSGIALVRLLLLCIMTIMYITFNFEWWQQHPMYAGILLNSILSVLSFNNFDFFVMFWKVKKEEEHKRWHQPTFWKQLTYNFLIIMINLVWVSYIKSAVTEISSQRLWVRFSGPKNVPSCCTHLGPTQVMEVIIIDVWDFWHAHFCVITSN